MYIPQDDNVAFVASISHDTNSLVSINSSISLADLVVETGLSDHADVNLGYRLARVQASIQQCTYVVSLSGNSDSVRSDLSNDTNGDSGAGKGVANVLLACILGKVVFGTYRMTRSSWTPSWRPRSRTSSLL